MYSLFLAGVALVVGLVFTQTGKIKDEKEAEQAQTASQISQELAKEFQATEDEEKHADLFKRYTEKFLSFAEKNKNEEGAEALFYVLQLPSSDKKNSAKAKAMASLEQDHAKTTKFGAKLKLLGTNPGNKEVRNLLKDIAENNKDKKTQAYAYRLLIKQSETAARFASRLKEEEDLKERFIKARGKAAVKTVLGLAETSEEDVKAFQAKLDGDLKGIFPDLSIGKAAPEVISQDLDGKKVTLSDLKGKVVVLDFWATWCGPCVGMIPHTKELVKKMDGKPFVFVSISVDDEKQTVTDFMKKSPMPWTHWWAGNSGGVVEAWDVEAFPTLYILDAKGIIRKKVVGAQDEEDIAKEVAKLVKEAEGKTKPKTE